MRHKANIPTHRAQCLVCQGSKEAQLVSQSPCRDELATLSRLSREAASCGWCRDLCQQLWGTTSSRELMSCYGLGYKVLLYLLHQNKRKAQEQMLKSCFCLFKLQWFFILEKKYRLTLLINYQAIYISTAAIQLRDMARCIFFQSSHQPDLSWALRMNFQGECMKCYLNIWWASHFSAFLQMKVK